ncbi:MAG: hypothetical protein ACF8PN_04785 [Phycisphaerales bacterium]
MTGSAMQIDILGAHPIKVTDDLVTNQVEVLYGPDADDEAATQVRAQLESVALIEARVKHPDREFDVGDFRQGGPTPSENDQVAFDERFLAPDGEREIDEPLHFDECDELRLVFFLHEYDPDGVIHSSVGPRRPPSPTPIPTRLERLASYTGTD